MQEKETKNPGIDNADNVKVALVAGANQGVGFQIAKALANSGYTVYVGSRNPKNGEDAANKTGGNARAIILDVTSFILTPIRAYARSTCASLLRDAA